jgi:lysozyme
MVSDADVLEIAIPQIKADEGCRLNAYFDTRGILTIGYGHTGPDVVQGLVWSQAQADAQILTDVAKFISLMDRFMPWWRSLDAIRAAALLEIVFQLGIGVLTKFPHAMAALKAGDYEDTYNGLLYQVGPSGPHSLWYQQTPARAEREAAQILTGELPVVIA